MEPKKSKKADLQRLRGLFLQIGFIFSLGMALLAFEWTSSPEKVKGFNRNNDGEILQESVPITRQQERKQPPPPPPPKTTEIINIVENNVEIEDELILEETEADQDTRVSIDAFEQEEEEEDDLNDVFVRVEDMPKFQGEGLNAFRRFVQRNLRYPDMAHDNGIEGTVYLRFIVDKDGSLTDISVLRGVDPALDEAAVAAVKGSPKWEPGKQRGKPVKVSCTMPIAFVLD
jgi:protein TonB